MTFTHPTYPHIAIACEWTAPDRPSQKPVVTVIGIRCNDPEKDILGFLQAITGQDFPADEWLERQLSNA